MEQSSQLFTYGTHWEFLPRENPKALSKIPTQFKQNNVTFLYLASNCSLCGFVKETLNSLEKTKGDNPNYALLKDKLFQTTPLAYPSDVKSAEKGLERRRKGNFKHNVVELLESGNDDEATDYFLSTTMFDYVLDNVFPNKKWEMLSNVFSEMNDRGLNIRDTQQLLDFYKKHLDTKKGQTLENTILPIYNDLPQTTEMALWALEIYDFLKTDYTKPSILVDNRYRINYQQIYNSFFNGDQFLIDLVNFLALLSYLEDNEVITNIKS